MSVPAKVRPIKATEPDLYHGVPVLPLKVGDPIPTPRAPERYAVRVYPDLARYLLGFNPEHNRSVRPGKVAAYSSDMRDGLWWFTPESIVFSASGVLQNGQHRLVAVSEYGSDVWMMFDFGWPEGLINALDRGAPKNSKDALSHQQAASATTLAGAINLMARYEAVVGQTRGFSGLVAPSTMRAMETYHADVDGWQTATRVGKRVYDSLDKGFGASVWATAYRLIAEAHPDRVDEFFEAVCKGTEPAGSATRQLADWARRRPMTATRTGDTREPLEIIIRAFNAWRVGRSMAFPKAVGFTLSRVK